MFFFRLNLQEYLDKYDIPENKDKLVNIRLWVQNLEYLNKISGKSAFELLMYNLNFNV